MPLSKGIAKTLWVPSVRALLSRVAGVNKHFRNSRCSVKYGVIPSYEHEECCPDQHTYREPQLRSILGAKFVNASRFGNRFRVAVRRWWRATCIPTVNFRSHLTLLTENEFLLDALPVFGLKYQIIFLVAFSDKIQQPDCPPQHCGFGRDVIVLLELLKLFRGLRVKLKRRCSHSSNLLLGYRVSSGIVAYMQKLCKSYAITAAIPAHKSSATNSRRNLTRIMSRRT